MLWELNTALMHATGDPSVRVVVLTGSGEAFSAGVDLKALGKVGEAQQANLLNQ